MSPAVSATTLGVRRSPRLVAWVRAWRAGLVPYDEVAEEVEGGEEHMVTDAPGAWTDVPLQDALAGLSKLHPDQIRLVLPAPGDPRGLPGPGTPFTGVALLAGEGMLAGPYGFVPQVRTHTSGSGDTFSTVLWHCLPVPDTAAARTCDPSPAEAESELAMALAEATTAMTRLDIAHWRPELSGALAALRRRDDGCDLPPGYDQRARRIYARASLLDRVLALAEQSAPGGAVNTYEAQRRDAALRPLMTACRRALVAACNAPVGGEYTG